jgi:hypothetical protein
MKSTQRLNWHTMIDSRNRELHQIIADKIRHNPALMVRVKEIVERWLRAMHESERGYDSLKEWKRRLESQSLDNVLDFMASADEEACRLRQSSPFVGLLSDEERMAVFRKYEAVQS